MSDLAPYLRDRIASTSSAYLAAALNAVVDKCEALRAEPALRPDMNERFAAEFEQTIARTLGPTD